MAERLTRV